MSSTSSAEPACTVCNKKQSELSNPLKKCAKCLTQSYCSRDCQKADWKNHKRVCATGPGPNTNPLKDTMLEHAQSTVDLLKALTHAPDFQIDMRAMPKSAAGLMYLCDFVAKTFREYWSSLIPPQKFAELSADLESFHGIEKERFLRDSQTQFEQARGRNSSFDKDAWPEFDAETYRDCKSRNAMAAGIVLDVRRQGMMGGRYDYPEEVKEICKRIKNM